MDSKFANTGFTLLELLFCITILFVILGIGLPAFSHAIDSSKRKDAVYNLVRMLNFARDSAVSNSTDVVICPTQNHSTCETTKNWNSDLMVFVDSNKNQLPDNDEHILQVFDQSDSRQQLTWKSFQNKPWLSFHADGSTGYQSGRIYYCYGDETEITQRAQIIIYRSGRARIASENEFEAGC